MPSVVVVLVLGPCILFSLPYILQLVSGRWVYAFERNRSEDRKYWSTRFIRIYALGALMIGAGMSLLLVGQFVASVALLLGFFALVLVGISLVYGARFAASRSTGTS